MREDEPPIRVMALHALLYCERLFYLEEVEEIRVANANVYAGRRLHDEVVSEEDETPEQRSVEVASELWGIQGKVDAVRKRDGEWVAYEHKKGRCRRGDDKRPEAWPSDRIQAIAYAVLLGEAIGEAIRDSHSAGESDPEDSHSGDRRGRDPRLRDLRLREAEEPRGVKLDRDPRRLAGADVTSLPFESIGGTSQ